MRAIHVRPTVGCRGERPRRGGGGWILLILVGVVAQACCLPYSQSPTYRFEVWSAWGESELRWQSQTTTPLDADPYLLSVELFGVEDPSPEIVRFYRVDAVGEVSGAVRVEVEAFIGAIGDEGTDHYGCQHPVVDYPLESLPNGVYLVVHPRANAPVELRPPPPFPWTDFEGEEAVLTWLVLDGS